MRGQAHDPADDLEHDVDSASMSAVIGALCAGDVQGGSRTACETSSAERIVCPVIAPNSESGIMLVTNWTKPIFSPESTPGILLASSGGDVDVHAVAGFEDVGDGQADEHRHQRQDDEVAQRLDADAAGFAQAVHGGDAAGYTTQNTTGTTIILTRAMNQSLSGLSCLADGGQQQADGDAQDGADDDLEPEFADQAAESGSPLRGLGGWWWSEVDMMGCSLWCGATGVAGRDECVLGGGRWPGSDRRARRPAVNTRGTGKRSVSCAVRAAPCRTRPCLRSRCRGFR